MEKIKSMTSMQSLIGSAVLLIALFIFLFWPHFGRELLAWIECHPGLAAWVQAIFSIIAIFGILIQAKLHYKTERKLRSIDEDKLLFNVVIDISNNSKWLKQKISQWDMLIAGISTSEFDLDEKDVSDKLEHSLDLVLMELAQFERRFLKNVSDIKNDWQLNHSTEILLSNLIRLITKIKSKSNDLISEKESLIKNCEALITICHRRHVKLHTRLSDSLNSEQGGFY